MEHLDLDEVRRRKRAIIAEIHTLRNDLQITEKENANAQNSSAQNRDYELEQAMRASLVDENKPLPLPESVTPLSSSLIDSPSGSFFQQGSPLVGPRFNKFVDREFMIDQESPFDEPHRNQTTSKNFKVFANNGVYIDEENRLSTVLKLSEDEAAHANAIRMMKENEEKERNAMRLMGLIDDVPQIFETEEEMLDRALRESQEQAEKTIGFEEQIQKKQEGLELEEKVCREEETQEKLQKRYHKIQKIKPLPEPDPKDPNTIRLVIQLPGNIRLERNFLNSHNLGDLRTYIDSKIGTNDISVAGNYNIVKDYPKKIWGIEQNRVTLSQAGFKKRELIRVEEA